MLLKGIGRAVVRNLQAGKVVQGGSTLTQQTARNLFLWSGGRFFRKGLEAYFTVLIDITWPKRRVLEVYANIAELGDGIYGVEAASQAYFHAVLPNPRGWHADRPSPYIQRRAAWIEQQMRQLGGVAYVLDEHPPGPRVDEAQHRRRRR